MQVDREAARFNTLAMGRRWGKTIFGITKCTENDVMQHPVGWFSPSYKMLLEVWRESVRTFADVTARKSVQERRLEFITGGVLEFWSLDNQDAARGRKYRRIIVDEAAMVPNLMDAWQFVLRPTLADYEGDAWFLSTPKGRNGFWQMFQWGQDAGYPEWASWQMPSATNPHLPQSEIDDMQRTMPERVFAQEILAQFIEDAGGVFRNVSSCATAKPIDKSDGSEYLVGVDWGKHNDFTAFSVFDVATKTQVYLDRFNQIDYTVQVGRLKALAQRFAPLRIVAERNSMGDPIVELLQREGLSVQPFTTTNASKKEAIEALALAFERQDIAILNDSVQIAELQAYEMERTPSGMLRYNAPAGMHDDTVMAMAMAWSGVARPIEVFIP